MLMYPLISPLTRKSLADIGRRKLRAIGAALGIALGVMGFTAISLANAQLIHGPADATQTAALNGVGAITQALALITLAVSCLLLLNVITTLLVEQLPVIGTMKTLGATRWQVARAYLVSIALYASVGTALGLGLGIAGSAILTHVFASRLGISLNATDSAFLTGASLPSLIEGSLIGIGVPLVAAFPSIAFGTRITVREALVGYAIAPWRSIEANHNVASTHTRAGRLIHALPQALALGVRNFTRRRLRATLATTTLAITVIAFLATQTAVASFGAYFTDLSATYHAPVFAFFATPTQAASARNVVASAAGVVRVEQLERAVIQTRWGKGELLGVEPTTRLFSFHLLAGRWFSSAAHNIVVISEQAARVTGLGVGATLTLGLGATRVAWRIVGISRTLTSEIQSFGVLIAPVAQLLAIESAYRSLTANELMIGVQGQPSQLAIDSLAQRITMMLMHNGYAATVQTRQQIDRLNQGLGLALYALLYVAASLIGLVGALGLAQTLAMNVYERQREIGVLRAMGATSWVIAQTIWMEGLTLSIVAWALALLPGALAGYLFVSWISELLIAIPYTFDPLALGSAFLITLTLATLATVGPAWQAARLPLRQTLTYE